MKRMRKKGHDEMQQSVCFFVSAPSESNAEIRWNGTKDPREWQIHSVLKEKYMNYI